MDSSAIVDAIGLIALPVFGSILYFYWNQIVTLHRKCSELSDELNDLKLHVAEEYLNRDDFKDTMKELKDSILLINDKIDRLVERK